MKNKVAGSRKKAWKYRSEFDLFLMTRSYLPPGHDMIDYFLSIHRNQGFSDASFEDRWFRSIRCIREREFYSAWNRRGREKKLAAIWPHRNQEER